MPLTHVATLAFFNIFCCLSSISIWWWSADTLLAWTILQIVFPWRKGRSLTNCWCSLLFAHLWGFPLELTRRAGKVGLRWGFWWRKLVFFFHLHLSLFLILFIAAWQIQKVKLMKDHCQHPYFDGVPEVYMASAFSVAVGAKSSGFNRLAVFRTFQCLYWKNKTFVFCVSYVVVLVFCISMLQCQHRLSFQLTVTLARQ